MIAWFTIGLAVGVIGTLWGIAWLDERYKDKYEMDSAVEEAKNIIAGTL